MFYLITVKWMGGFTHKVPCMRFNLKSQIEFTKTLNYVEEFSYEQVSEEEYNKYVYGEKECQSSQPVAIKSKTSKKPTTSARKSGKSTTKAGTKRSPTKPSAKPATKSTRKTTPSSKPKPKKPTGSPAKKTGKPPAKKTVPKKKVNNEPTKPKRVRKA